MEVLPVTNGKKGVGPAWFSPFRVVLPFITIAPGETALPFAEIKMILVSKKRFLHCLIKNWPAEAPTGSTLSTSQLTAGREAQ